MIARLSGRVAAVTGAASGIGRAFAVRLAEEGAAVAVLDLNDGSDVVSEIEAAGSRGVSFTLDVSDPELVTMVASQVHDTFGSVDILINNAGVYPPQPLEGMSIQDWQRMFRINVESMFLTSQAFSPGMQSRGWGRIVNMTSNSIGMVAPGLTAYIASKMAVIGLTRGLATELAAYGITANAVAPSLTRTASTGSAAQAEEFFRVVAGMQAIKRVQVPADLVGTVAFLASDDAAFITGQTIYVDGGLHRSA